MQLVLSSVLISVLSATPLPQDPNDEVEVISGPVSTNDGDFNFGGGFFPRVRVFLHPADTTGEGSIGGVEGFLDILKSVFGSSPTSNTNKDETAKRPCVLCNLFDETISDVQDHIDSVRDRENEIDLGEGDEGFNINNSTHTKTVLEDGTVVHINKTTISNTDDDGNSFFFHRSIIHNVGNNDGRDIIDEGLPEEEEAEELETGVDDGLFTN